MLSLQKIAGELKGYESNLDKLGQYQKLCQEEIPQKMAYVQQCYEQVEKQEAHCEYLHTQQKEQYGAVLAAQLKDGEPCPVCGATTHLQPQMPPENLINEDEIQRQDELLKNVRKRSSEAEKDLEILKNKASDLLEEIFAGEGKIFTDDREAFARWYQQKCTAYAELQDQHDRQNEQLGQLEKELATQPRLLQEEQALKEQLQQLEAEPTTAPENIAINGEQNLAQAIAIGKRLK